MAWVSIIKAMLPVEQHGDELDDHNAEEEEHKDDTNGLQMEILLGDEYLDKESCVIDVSILLLQYQLLAESQTR